MLYAARAMGSFLLVVPADTLVKCIILTYQARFIFFAVRLNTAQFISDFIMCTSFIGSVTVNDSTFILTDLIPTLNLSIGFSTVRE